jgi:flap endonuclease-1
VSLTGKNVVWQKGLRYVKEWIANSPHQLTLFKVERRKEVRRLAVARGLLENDRLKRLRRLSDVLYRFRNLDIVTRERTAELLRQLHPDDGIPLSAVPSPSTAFPRTGDQAKTFNGHLPDATSGLTSDDEREALFSLMEEDLWSSPLNLTSGAEQELMAGFPSSDELPSEDGLAVRDPSGPEDAAALDAAALAQSFEDSLSLSSGLELPMELEDICASNVTLHAGELMTPEVESSAHETSPLPKAQSDSDSLGGASYDPAIVSQEREDVNAAFASLYLDFRQSISKLALLAARETSALSPSVSTPSSDLDTQTEIVMTKAQYQLTLDEQSLWEQLVSSPSIITHSSDDEFASAVEMNLANLTQTSNVMSESYQRRTNPPTGQNYEESKTIIQAMGVPCIDSVGPFEAEALASSIVLSGLADYVASEDTVRTPILPRHDLSRDEPFSGCFGV